MEITQIEYYGIVITEPFTWLTNWLFAAFSFYFGHMLFHSKSVDKQGKYWSLFFVAMGLASTTGGTAHGFVNYVGVNFHFAAWIFTGIAVCAAQLAALEIIKDSKIYHAGRIFVTIELLIMMAAVIFFQSFEAVRVNSAFGLIGLVLPLQLYAYKTFNMKRNGIIALGILSNIGPALIHAAKFSYNKWFNFNDLSHMVMIGCFYIVYLGARKVSIKNSVTNSLSTTT